LLTELLLVLHRADVAQWRVPPLAVVPDLVEVEERALGLAPGVELGAGEEIVFERREHAHSTRPPDPISLIW
jgi:hypothetical protein